MQYGASFGAHDSCGGLLHFSRACLFAVALENWILSLTVCLTGRSRVFFLFVFFPRTDLKFFSRIAEDSSGLRLSCVFGSLLEEQVSPQPQSEAKPANIIVTFSFFTSKDFGVSRFSRVLLGINFSIRKNTLASLRTHSAVSHIAQRLNNLGFILFSVDLVFLSVTLIK